MAKYIKIFSFLIILIFGCFSLNAQTDSILLEQAYKKKSVKMLDQFFMNWRKAVPTVTNEELSQMNDTIRSAYKVFECYYNKHNKYKNVKYLIIQNKLFIHVSDENDIEKMKDEDFFYWEIKYDSITNFRPRINIKNRIPVYLTSYYEKILNVFLGDIYSPLGTGGIMNPARPEGESKERRRFLEDKIKIEYGHWGGYWHLNSFPEINIIIFNKDMKSALIYFRYGYRGGESYLIKKNANWKIVDSKFTWIE